MQTFLKFEFATFIKKKLRHYRVKRDGINSANRSFIRLTADANERYTNYMQLIMADRSARAKNNQNKSSKHPLN